MMLFSIETGLERVRVVGPDLDRWWVSLQALDVSILCKKQERRGSARASPVAAPMPKSVSF